ncbi:AraC family transcriptional regulator [Dactylosporangium sp. NPDC006015]|uniref:helix-turn-helix transcriptional regulator n=1 Tax=Dactylosporangium sp. NPDC006015 TaxID=3154576 RepID=UPI0033A9E9B6
MDDFASGALVAAVLRSLTDDGIAVSTPAPGGALVPLAVKRRLLADVAATHGLLPLLRVGLILPRLPPDPAMSALAAATGPQDLFARWARLERFVHSRHRVVVHSSGERTLTASHTGPADEPPTPAEDALVAGVLVALLTATGVHGLSLTFGPWPVYADGTFTAPPPDHRGGPWHFTWTSVAAPPAPSRAGTDPARALLAGDLVRRWTLRDLAAELGMSPRTVQRHLRAEGGFSGLLAAARADAAAGLLIDTRHALGVVGFASGYTDQPHFTREFRRRTAMTPAAFRSAFARPLASALPAASARPVASARPAASALPVAFARPVQETPQCT